MAVDFCRLSLMAEQGNATAQCYLGIMYGIGQGVPQDYVRPTPGSVLPPLVAIKRPRSSGISSPNCSRTDPRPSCPVSTHVAVGSMGPVVFAVLFGCLAFAFGSFLLKEIRDPTPYGGGWDGW